MDRDKMVRLESYYLYIDERLNTHTVRRIYILEVCNIWYLRKDELILLMCSSISNVEYVLFGVVLFYVVVSVIQLPHIYNFEKYNK